MFSIWTIIFVHLRKIKIDYLFFVIYYYSMVYKFDVFEELSLVNEILSEYYSNDDKDYRIIIKNAIDKYMIYNSNKINKSIIKYYYKSIKNTFKNYKYETDYIYQDTSIIIPKIELFKTLAAIVLYYKIRPVIEKDIDS
jgi:hypothetical protein